MRVLIWVVGTHCLCSFERMERSHVGNEILKKANKRNKAKVEDVSKLWDLNRDRKRNRKESLNAFPFSV